MNYMNKCEIVALKVCQGEERGPLKAHDSPLSATVSRVPGFPGKVVQSWSTRAKPHASPRIPVDPYHAITCLSLISVF